MKNALFSRSLRESVVGRSKVKVVKSVLLRKNDVGLASLIERRVNRRL